MAPLQVALLSGSRLDSHCEQVLDAWADWLIAHPRVHVAIECPKLTDAKAIYDYFVTRKKLRAERLAYRGGTAYVQNQIRLQ